MSPDSSSTPLLHFDRFPFFVGAGNFSSLAGLPGMLPLSLDVHPRFAIPQVVVSSEVQAALALAYGKGSMLSTPLGEGVLAEARLNETLECIDAIMAGGIPGKAFLEIGCGTGALLNAVKQRGGKVLGCEIGPQGKVATEKYGIRVIDRPLSPELIEAPVDCLYSYGVLEHIEDLESLFSTARDVLKPGGLFFHAVPNGDLIFSQGKLEDLCHEHVNYFTSENATRLFACQGFENPQASTNRSGNELYIWGFRSPSPRLSWPGSQPGVIEAARQHLQESARRIQRKTQQQLSVLETWLEKGESVGLYAGGYILASLLSAPGKIRFYDSDQSKFGKQWLPHLSHILPPADLRPHPVDHLVICPQHHFDKIRESLAKAEYLSQSVQITSLAQLADQPATP